MYYRERDVVKERKFHFSLPHWSRFDRKMLEITQSYSEEKHFFFCVKSSVTFGIFKMEEISMKLELSVKDVGCVCKLKSLKYFAIENCNGKLFKVFKGCESNFFCLLLLALNFFFRFQTILSKLSIKQHLVSLLRKLLFLFKLKSSTYCDAIVFYFQNFCNVSDFDNPSNILVKSTTPWLEQLKSWIYS